MTKRIVKIAIILILAIITINTFTYQVQAVGTIDGVMQGAQDFLNKGRDEAGATVQYDKLNETSNFIYNLLLGIAMIVAVVVGLVIGIKFMVSSVEEKAKIKEALVPYVVGCIVVFGAFGIWKLVVTVLSRV